MSWDGDLNGGHLLPLWSMAYLQRRFIGLVFGLKGTCMIMSMEYFCCERPNPILQVIYIAIIGSTFLLNLMMKLFTRRKNVLRVNPRVCPSISMVNLSEYVCDSC